MYLRLFEGDEDMKFCFVILHYLADKDTIECIDSIERLDNSNDTSIIVVDNYSNNGSIERVEEFVASLDNCSIIKNKENLGFAKGNNVGYKYAIQMHPGAFVIVLNNDTIIEQKDFLKKIENSYQENAFAVMGPDIISLVDKGHQNPLGKVPDKKTLKKQVFKFEILLILSKLGVYNIFQGLFGKREKLSTIRAKKSPSTVLSDRALHGACLIFSPLFTTQMKEAFCSETFLYKEEFILQKICERNKLKMFYDSRVEIYHKEDSSTNMVVSSAKEKREFLFKNLIESSKVLLKYI